ncbi:amino acid ABC transporter permease [Nocardia puris]|uniref:Polar amino acid transport system permease protein n=1 Tax=Nocardia puris TaxID=208602 RepID=A0A366DWF1_9NOCA|nr:amino acid ABC transporter permease [Nocardia puris]MBF6209856.1 amino acid ABC transporter permease [Nocardia puris]MBF6366428.1 amino acid ABC transporter permease [Nocardia puris]MBF6458233.1 amino acid ABC transporter permease [Nocardia puris]RBO94406.1 polar amino acid transport system permease protein [Nocardia puris]
MGLWRWDKFWDAFPYIWDGLLVTIQFTVLGALVAYTLGLAFAVLLRSRVPVVYQLLWLFIEFVRSTPLLVQLFVLYWVVRPALLDGLSIDTQRVIVGVAALGVHYACYTAEVYRAGIEAVPAAQWEAAVALNLPRGRTWTDVILPQAIPRVLPALGNYTISMFKEVPLLSAIVVLDMVYQIKTAYAADTGGAGPEAWFAVGLTFLALSYPCSLLVRKLERRVEFA